MRLGPDCDMSTYQCLLRDITHSAAQQERAEAFGVLGDWLEEHGDAERANACRELARRAMKQPMWPLTFPPETRHDLAQHGVRLYREMRDLEVLIGVVVKQLVTSAADDISCQRCTSPAVVQYVEPNSGARQSFCNEHRLDPEIQQQLQNWELKRNRFTTEDSASERLWQPLDSEEHQSLYLDMCEPSCFEGDGAVRYYFSIITGID